MKNRQLDFQVWTRVLVYLYYHHSDDDITSLRICKEVDITLSSVSHNISLLRNNKLIDFELDGRTNKYVLTEKGLKLGELLSKVFTVLK